MRQILVRVAWSLAALLLMLSAISLPVSRGEARARGAQGDLSESTPGRWPDIVLIVTDDQRVGLLDAMPTVRRVLSSRGVTYSNAMVPTSLCCPSRASLLTGMYAHGTGVWTNGPVKSLDVAPGGERVFMRNGNERRTLAVALDSVGYRTGLVGKYLNGYRQKRGVPRGWDKWMAFDGAPNYYHYRLGAKRFGGVPREYSTDVIARKARRVIRSTPASRPLFLYVAPFAPHYPFTPAPRDRRTDVSAFVHRRDFGALNERNVTDKPLWLQGLDLTSRSLMHDVAESQHRAMMSVDRLVRVVVDSLRVRGNLHHTLLVFTSDNGLLWGEHRLAMKNMPYARATEVPLVIRWDSHLPAGASRRAEALNIDVTATIADAARLDMPWIEGRSLLQRAGGGSIVEAARTFPSMYSAVEHYVRRPAYCGWRTRTRLYVRYATGEEELYLYRSDPFERRNVAHVPAHRQVLRAMRRHARAACAPAPPGFSWRG
jgi:N-acetylglucosamine-6-sulfatase